MHGLVHWNVSGGRVLGPAPFFVVGIVNVTPDSFYDGGAHATPEAGVAHGLKLIEDGAHILDVGGESTRPTAERVGTGEELRRVVPVVRELARHIREKELDTVVSVDTYKAATAAAALEAGAVIVNDVSGCRYDPELIDVLAQYQPGYVLMHCQGVPGSMQNEPSYVDVVDEIMDFFDQRLRTLTRAGVPEENIVLDPGVGFGKTLEHNLEILRNIEIFGRFGLPVYVGLSNKSLWGALLGLETDQRQNATQVGTALLASRGVQIHRVHEVAMTVQTMRIVQAIDRRSVRGRLGVE
ncbi:dihydropteroate synthase [Desulfobaculum xiamenense]|uniref:Dihydropteroate synthase n=1 Tax=Desulfobaculum xiamenense TaxID=995050 RepID=A0A846QMI9_9BACT|nr:dihydropteroate synthase [Desulfobaculum xiamenense]NJB67453.1 dihydropteroate synthase [Desulfobaculum xiamenense]